MGGPVRIIGVALAVVLAASPVVANAQTVPVDPGPIGKGRPIVGTTQNLPSLNSSEPYDAGPGFAPQLRAIYEDGTIRALQADVAQQGRQTIRAWQRQHPKASKPAVIFDVDDTMLNNYVEYSTNSPAFSYDREKDTQNVNQCKATANVPCAASTASWSPMASGSGSSPAAHRISARQPGAACVSVASRSGTSSSPARMPQPP
jgi:hypothetical protein